ncbi:MAG: hypothetical protein A3J72_01060 [Nitrospirae bacterium RIFCSPHIGHO2_02_FULL_40_19]|nr:MAG: hypothetical protein A3J72_01060 [Nitrospirae bacterium RIFCSPHIGHO2_02_FULL_40_19]
MKEINIFDNPRNVKILLMLLFGGCLALLIINFFVHKHGHFSWEEWSGFYAAYGFVACVGLVLAAKFILRKIVKRSEDYYD